MERNTDNSTNTENTSGATSRRLRRSTALVVACGLLMAACGSDSTENTASAVETTQVADNTEEVSSTEEVAADEAAADQGPPPGEGGEGQGPPPGEGGEGQGPPPGDAAQGGEDSGDSLTDGPQNVGEHGPFSNADFDRDGTVTRDELGEFMDGALEREIGLVAFFDLYDNDADAVLDADELATVDPAYAFDGTDTDADGLVSLIEVTDYANEEGRSYRAIGLGNFFDLVDTDGNDEVSPEEIEVAHESGLLARF